MTATITPTRAIVYTLQLGRHHRPRYHLPAVGAALTTRCGRHYDADNIVAAGIALELPLWAAVRIAPLCGNCRNIAGILITEDPGDRRPVTTINLTEGHL